MENLQDTVNLMSAAPADEAKPVEQIVVPEAAAVESEVDGSTEEQSSGDSVDYRQLYEETEDRLKKAEFALYKKNKSEKQNKTVSIPQEVESTEIEALVETKAIEILEAQRKKDSEDLLEEELMRSSTNPDERDLIKLIYDNKIIKTGYSRMSIRNDIEDAKALANKSRLVKQTKEMAQALNAKRSTSTTSVGSNQSKNYAPKEDLSKHFSATDWHFIQQRGWSQEMIQDAIKQKGIK